MKIISLHNISKSTFCLAIVLLSLGLPCLCEAKMPDLREVLVRSLKGANLEGYYFATEEDDTQVVASLTNNVVRNLIKLDSGTNNLVLRYTIVKDKKKNTTMTYKTEVVKTDTVLTLLVTDIATGGVVSINTFPDPEPHNEVDTIDSPPTFDSIEDCIKDFNYTGGCALQCEANRTCKNQFAHLLCCIENDLCFGVLMIINPTTLKCRLSAGVAIPDVEGFILSR